MSERAAAYAFPEGVPVAPVEAGGTVVVTGDFASGASDLALELVLEGARRGEASLVVGTDDAGASLLEDCRERTGGRAGEDLAVVDCTPAEARDGSTPTGVVDVPNPGDLTGLSMAMADCFDGFGRPRVRVGLLDLQTLLMYADLDTVSRFVHTLAGRVASLDALAVLHLDPGAVDGRVVSTLEQFASVRVRVRQREGTREVATSRPGDPAADWTTVVDAD